MNIQEILYKSAKYPGYDFDNLTIGVLGGHSALEMCRGAKDLGFRTVVVAQKGREKTFTEGYKTRTVAGREIGCVDEVILVDHFSDILKPEIQEQLRELNTIFVHNRYFWVYFDDFSKVENDFHVPIFGTRELLKLEERDIKPNQYDLLQWAGIRIPKMFEIPKLKIIQHFVGHEEKLESTRIEFSLKNEHVFSPGGQNKQIDRIRELAEKKQKEGEKVFLMDCLTLTKVCNAQRTYERENFVASSWEEWLQIANEKLACGEIKVEDLQQAVIEEFILGAQVNFNYFYSPLTDSLELMGTDTRRQTNLDGWLRLPAREQMKIPQDVAPKHIETGHIAVTVKESLVEKALVAGRAFVEATKKHAAPGIIGPFALQGAIETDGKKEEFVVFDVSLRIPGSPGIGATPYSAYLYGESVSMGKRSAMEIRQAIAEGKIEEILT